MLPWQSHLHIYLLKKDAFTWTDDATLSFNNLKDTMMNTPILVHPNFSKEFCLETDASQWGIGQF